MKLFVLLWNKFNQWKRGKVIFDDFESKPDDQNSPFPTFGGAMMLREGKIQQPWIVIFVSKLNTFWQKNWVSILIILFTGVGAIGTIYGVINKPVYPDPNRVIAPSEQAQTSTKSPPESKNHNNQVIEHNRHQNIIN